MADSTSTTTHRQGKLLSSGTNLELCDLCRDVLVTKLQIKYQRGLHFSNHHTSPTDFFASAANGCEMCSRLESQLTIEHKQYIQAHEGQWLQKNQFTYVIAYENRLVEPTSIDGVFSIQLAISDPDCTIHGLPVNKSQPTPVLFLTAQPHTSVDQKLPVAPLGESTADDAAWATAKRWLDTCISDHSSCSQQTPTAIQYPTRLLDVAKLDDNIVTLVDTAATHLNGPYLTLSHSWGLKPFYKLTVSNIDSMHAGIALQQVKQSFQDALSVTKKMGVRYLWIDSLCIIQDGDDHADWEIESKLMYRYYRNALCNLSATASVDGTEGFYRPRKKSMTPLYFEMPQHDQRPAGLYNLFDVSQWNAMLDKAPLHKRAWVMQERLLSRRVLHFGDGQLLWECAEQTCAEMYPDGVPNVGTLQESAHLKDFIGGSSRLQQLHDAGNDRDHLRALFAKIAARYSSCLLTVASDRIPAFDGIRKHFETKLKDDCIYGLWKSTFLTDLLWRAADNTYPPDTKSQTYDLPSWTWLASPLAIACCHHISRVPVATVRQGPSSTLTHGEVHPLLELQCCIGVVNTLCVDTKSKEIRMVMPDVVIMAAEKISQCTYNIYLDRRVDTLDKSEVTEIWPAWFAISTKSAVNGYDLLVEGLILQMPDKQTQIMKRIGKIELDCGSAERNKVRAFTIDLAKVLKELQYDIKMM